MLVLFIPWVLLTLCVVALLCLLKRWYWVGGLLLVMALVVNWHWQVFAFGWKTLSDKKEEGTLRVMTWNVDMTLADAPDRSKEIAMRILEQEADVVFLTEYGADEDLMDSLLRAEYPYTKCFGDWQSRYYAKLPADTVYHIEETEDYYSMRFCYRARFRGSPVSVYACHLASNNHEISADSVETKEQLWQYLENYEKQSEKHRKEVAGMIEDMRDEPCIVMGDMNDVCGSPCIRVFENAGLRDAWWKGGFGYGATIHKPLAYRIDHVMYGFKKGSESSDGLKLKGIRKVSANGLSDHDALVADFTLHR